ncbi:MAG: copper resistance protein CopQ, partial [Cupriavidus sp.]
MNAKTILTAAALAAAFIGGTAQAAQGTRDPYTDGARIAARDVFTDGAR